MTIYYDFHISIIIQLKFLRHCAITWEVIAQNIIIQLFIAISVLAVYELLLDEDTFLLNRTIYANMLIYTFYELSSIETAKPLPIPYLQASNTMKTSCHISTFIMCTSCASHFTEPLHKAILVLSSVVYNIRCKCLTKPTLYLIKTLPNVCSILCFLHQEFTTGC